MQNENYSDIPTIEEGASSSAALRGVLLADLGAEPAKAEVLDFPAAADGEELDEDGASPQEIQERESSPWRFVAHGWFQGIAAVIIFANIVLMLLAPNLPSRCGAILEGLDHFFLCFYIFEIAARVLYFRRYYLCGHVQVVAWNVLDVTVVAAGLVEQCVISLLPQSLAGSLQCPLRVLRFLRLFRGLKIARIFLESDLSWTGSSKFQSFMGFVIAFNSFLMGLETDYQWEGWIVIEFALLTFYTFELLCNIKHSGCHFFSCSHPDFTWNILDFFIVATSVCDSWLVPILHLVVSSLTGGSEEEGSESREGIPIGQLIMLMRMLRLLRILRLLKLIRSVRPLFLLVTGVVTSLQGVFWVLVLTIVTLYAMGIMATRLIGQGLIFPDPTQIHDELKPFSCVPDSMFTLFRVMSGSSSSEESAAIDFMLEQQPTARFAFIFFMVTSSWTMLSILTAVVSERMIATTEQQGEEEVFKAMEEQRNQQTKSLIELFEMIDQTHDGKVSHKEVIDFLDDEESATEVLLACKVRAKDAIEVLHTLEQTEHNEIDLVHFVERLQDASSVVKEKSVMKLEARVVGLEDILKEILITLQDNGKRPKVEQVEPLSLHEFLAEAAQSHQQRPDSEAAETTGSSESSEVWDPRADIKLQEAVQQAVIAKLDLLVEHSRKHIAKIEGVQQALRQALSQQVAREVAAAAEDASSLDVCRSADSASGEGTMRSPSSPALEAAQKAERWQASDALEGQSGHLINRSSDGRAVHRELDLASSPFASMEPSRIGGSSSEHAELVVRDNFKVGQLSASELRPFSPL